MASRSIAKADRLHPRAALRVFLIAIALVLCVLPHLLWRVVGARSPWPRMFLRVSGRIAGARVSLVGTPVPTNVLYIANHVSWLDILLTAGRTGCAFVAKADMVDWPILGWLATLNNSVYVEREKRLDVGAQRDAIQTALKTGQPITLFPEGTTGDGRTLLTFRSSLLATVAPPPSGVAIQPLAIDYGPDAPAIAWTDAESVGHNALRLMARRDRLNVTLRFLDPLDPADFTDRKAMAAHSRDAIAAALGLPDSSAPKEGR